jgi:hypothetical protein
MYFSLLLGVYLFIEEVVEIQLKPALFTRNNKPVPVQDLQHVTKIYFSLIICLLSFNLNLQLL